MKHHLKTKRKFLTKDLKKDLAIIFLGLIVAYFIVQTEIFGTLLGHVTGWYPLASFVMGIFFTSAFTLAPASIALAKIAETAPAIEIALWGGLGAMVGDLIIFLFIRDRFARDLKAAFRTSKIARSIFNGFHLGFMKWITPLLGALIIASPLPDEFGLALLGFSKVRLVFLLPIAFVMNCFGILCLISFAQYVG